MEPKLIEAQAIALAKKALMDIGHWEDFKIVKAVFSKILTLYDYGHWYVSFYFTEKDWHKGEVTPYLIVNDDEQIVTVVSWKKSWFSLSYDAAADKYYHPTLSREQKKF